MPGLVYGGGDVRVTICNDGAYCCGQSNSSCCINGDGVALKDGQVVSKSHLQIETTLVISETTADLGTTSSTSELPYYTYYSPTPTMTTQPSDTPVSTQAARRDQKYTLDQKIQLGLGLGIGLPATLATLTMAFLKCIRRAAP